MSSGSYFTLYRRFNEVKAPSETIEALKNEYFLANKKELFAEKQDDEAMKKDIPLLLWAGFKADFAEREAEDNKTDVYYSDDGTKHIKLLVFHFGSTFTALKDDHFCLNPYKFNQNSVLISKLEAEKILQAIDYVLSEDYNKKFEQVLNNGYVELLGNGYSPFDKRFRHSHEPIYIDREGHGYTVNFGDSGYSNEISESDEDVKFNLNCAKACLLAFLNAEESTYDGEELVLEYSAY